MKLYESILAAGALAVGVTLPLLPQAPPAAVPAPSTPLVWAYPINAPSPPAPPSTDPTLLHVPNSSKAFTKAQVTDGFNPPDWHSDHPSMPEIVGHGRRPDIRACGYCHLPNGQGRPENASIAGLPASYIVAQVADFRTGLRHSSEPAMGPPDSMLKLSRVSNDDEVKIAADYFSKIKYKAWIKVKEVKMVPKTKVVVGMLVAEGKEMEPIGSRVIETPEELEPTELRDSGSPFIAYVPIGSIKKGEELVTKGGNGKTVRCSICHGQDLKGLGNVPFLAGRSPSYLARQLWDIKSGNRKGAWSPLMKEAVANLTTDDIVNVVAYIASRPVQ